MSVVLRRQELQKSLLETKCPKKLSIQSLVYLWSLFRYACLILLLRFRVPGSRTPSFFSISCSHFLVEPLKMNNANKLLLAGRSLMATRARHVSNTAVRRVAADEVHPGYKKLKPIQEKFQVEDGLEVHLKGGFLDVALYKLTLGLCVLAIGANLKLYYDLAFPKKK